jgi:hypothetical protein
MQIVSVSESSVAEMNRESIGVIAACGYESRSSTITDIVSRQVSVRKVIAFEEADSLFARQRNEVVFRDAGFHVIQSSGGKPGTIFNAVEELLSSATAQRPGIIIDISSMTRVWHGGVVRALMRSARSAGVTYFVYIRAKFSPPAKDSSHTEVVAPVEGFASLAPPNLPIALVVGLGYEPERALGLHQLLDPEKTVVMVPRLGKQDRFFTAVKRSNADILGRLPKGNVFEYPVDQPAATFRMLESISIGLAHNYRVVLASLGPKLFGIDCFLLASRHPEFSVWRVSQRGPAAIRDSKSDPDHVIVMRVGWRSELP